MTTMMRVECFRLWQPNYWDLGIVEIPADTPDELKDQAVQVACEACEWDEMMGAPDKVGYWADLPPDDFEDEEPAE